ncbi:MAG: tyrosine-type recombinase/integrase [Clostridiales Family XIII bacterium]|nr:tyrosine-type recombinase/integrase [Clostridiales Family XIII bacterium]
MKTQKASPNLGWIREELRRRLTVLRYSTTTAGVYMRIFGWIEEYLEGYGATEYSEEWGKRFIAEYSLQDNHRSEHFKSARTVVRRVDEILAGKLFSPCFRPSQTECPPRFADLLNRHLEYLEQMGYRKSTIDGRRRYAGQFLNRIPETVENIESLTASDLYGIFAKGEWIGSAYAAARGLLLYVHESGLTETDLSSCVPRPKRPRTLPSVYSGEEVTRLLSAVDRSTDIGKRDFAILMLASHLGLRSSDIVNLSSNDIDHVTKAISITQVKTGRPLTLVMNSDIEEAVSDYMQNGRPQSSSERIFLGTQAPFAPLSAGACCTITRKYFKLSGIDSQGRRRGPHSLRASYATALVANGIPYSIVKEALGHEDPESAKHYVRVDVRRLRLCALDVPKPSVAFAVMLGDLEGVM